MEMWMNQHWEGREWLGLLSTSWSAMSSIRGWSPEPSTHLPHLPPLRGLRRLPVLRPPGHGPFAAPKGLRHLPPRRRSCAWRGQACRRDERYVLAGRTPYSSDAGLKSEAHPGAPRYAGTP
jgi:hypothetical protein